MHENSNIKFIRIQLFFTLNSLIYQRSLYDNEILMKR